LQVWLALQCLAFHGKGLAKLGADVARCAAKAEHRVFFFGLVAAAADDARFLHVPVEKEG
jgi:hypothetical protein